MRGIGGYRELDACGDPTEPLLEDVSDLVVGALRRELVEHFVADARGHLLPAPLAREFAQLGSQLTPSVEVEGRPVRRRRKPERERLARDLARPRNLFLRRAGDDRPAE